MSEHAIPKAPAEADGTCPKRRSDHQDHTRSMLVHALRGGGGCQELRRGIASDRFLEFIERFISTEFDPRIRHREISNIFQVL